MRRSILSTIAFVLVFTASAAVAQGPVSLAANLRGFDEVPAVSSFGNGTFEATLSDDLTELTYELTYSGLSGTVTQAHIHLAQPNVNGGIMVFLCSNLGNGPAGTPECPEEGSVSRTVSAADIIAGANAQGVPAGNFFRFQRALRQNMGYANVHSDRFPGGEIRGQVQVTSP
jgi:hypothetical protein